MTTMTRRITPAQINADPLAQFGASVESAPASREPAWLAQLRETARDAFAGVGLPTAKHEEWRYTNLAPIREATFRQAPSELTASLASDALRQALPIEAATCMVFVNGLFAPHLSRIEAPEGFAIAPLSQLLRDDPDALRETLGSVRDVDDDAFAHLNTALCRDGPVVRVRAGARSDAPIHIVHLAVGDAQSSQAPIAAHPRTLVVVEDGADALLVEDCLSLGDAPALANMVAEVRVGANARCRYVSVERSCEQSWSVSSLRVQQEKSSDFAAHTLILGGALVRNNISPIFAGEDSHGVLNGLYLPRGEQHMDNHMRVVHAAPHCQSRQFYTGVMQDHSRGVFAGRIIVEQNAQQTDAIQSNRNLLLSPDARANTKPQLEIYADDVRCTHGATIGQLDEDAMFYLRTRGLTKREARAALVHAFVQESLDRIDDDALRAALGALVAQRLPGAETLGSLL